MKNFRPDGRYLNCSFGCFEFLSHSLEFGKSGLNLWYFSLLMLLYSCLGFSEYCVVCLAMNFVVTLSLLLSGGDRFEEEQAQEGSPGQQRRWGGGRGRGEDERGDGRLHCGKLVIFKHLMTYLPSLFDKLFSYTLSLIYFDQDFTISHHRVLARLKKCPVNPGS